MASGKERSRTWIFYYYEVMPVNRIDERSLQPGPLCRKTRELYWEFAHG